jgi:hypothetical protein
MLIQVHINKWDTSCGTGFYSTAPGPVLGVTTQAPDTAVFKDLGSHMVSTIIIYWNGVKNKIEGQVKLYSYLFLCCCSEHEETGMQGCTLSR